MKNEIIVYEGADYPERVVEFVEFVNGKLQLIPDEFRKNAKISLDSSLVCPFAIMCIYYKKED